MSKGADYERPLAAFCCDLITCFTTFASSIRNARINTVIITSEMHSTKTIIRVRTHLERTQPLHREPSYARPLFRLGHGCVLTWVKGNNLFHRIRGMIAEDAANVTH